jgi:hypothetical protein
VIRELLCPSDSIKKTFEGLKAHAALKRSMGLTNRDDSPKSIDMRVIRVHFGFSHVEFRAIKRELEKKLGVEI